MTSPDYSLLRRRISAASGPMAYIARLMDLNPWAREVSDAAFEAARKEACLIRYKTGIKSWNAWAEAMLSLKAKVESSTLSSCKWSNSFIQLSAADFRGVTFTGRVDFHRATFPGPAWFNQATFSGDARFNGAKFSDAVWFRGAKFSSDAWFDGAKFSSAAWFTDAKFSGNAGFSGAVFSGDAEFRGAAFSGNAGFYEAAFSGAAWFDKAVFLGSARFCGASFDGDGEEHEVPTKPFSLPPQGTLDGYQIYSPAEISQATDKGFFTEDELNTKIEILQRRRAPGFRQLASAYAQRAAHEAMEFPKKAFETYMVVRELNPDHPYIDEIIESLRHQIEGASE